ncbi:uncharacterized protein [Hyperolius riggenbachi]|uniref:uncharacterized protein n=1 Tax=Hyperolius riggenbachi TaxID=752182 RepID=UPI0035A2859E
MPSCIIEGCAHGTGRASRVQDVILHVFPNDATTVRNWVKSTGQSFQNIDLLVSKILEHKSTDLFRICSSHFNPECYEDKGNKKILKKGSIPTIFPSVPNNLLVNERKILSAGKRQASEPVAHKKVPKSTNVCDRCKRRMTTTGTLTFTDSWTQTDEPEKKMIIERVDPPHDLDFSTPMNGGPECLTVPQVQDLFSSESPRRTIYLQFPSTSCTLSDVWIETCTAEISMLTSASVVSEVLETAECSEQVSLSSGEAFDPKDIMVSESEVRVFEQIQDEPAPTVPGPESELMKNYVEMRKFLIFESCLDELISKVKCQADPSCHQTVKSSNKQLKGSAIIVRGVCKNGHRFSIFESQPRIKRRHAGNILLAASMLCSGSSFSNISHFMDVLGVANISPTTFHKYQRNYCFPAIQNAWEKEKNIIREEIGNIPVTIGGDGQCDSPGHSAKYCIYTFMDLMSNKIVDFEIAQTTQCTSSSAMKRYGFEKCMTRAVEKKLDIQHLATDDHVSIRKVMRENYSEIDHQFDVGHFAKNICHKLKTASKRAGCSALKFWIDEINTHFWWSVKHSNNSEEKLLQNWKSLLHHVINVHEWKEDGIIRRCSHAPLTDDEKEQGRWLQFDTVAYKTLEQIVLDKDLTSDFKHLIWGCHTGPLEEYHSNVLKYRTKRLHLGIDGMEARTILAALSNNNNTNREQAVVTKQSRVPGELGSKQFAIGAPKGRKKWVPKPRYNKHNFVNDILADCLRFCEGTAETNWVSRAGSSPKNISKLPKPDKQELITQYKTRF